jgi:hypothetical protein
MPPVLRSYVRQLHLLSDIVRTLLLGAGPELKGLFDALMTGDDDPFVEGNAITPHTASRVCQLVNHVHSDSGNMTPDACIKLVRIAAFVLRCAGHHSTAQGMVNFAGSMHRNRKWELYMTDAFVVMHCGRQHAATRFLHAASYAPTTRCFSCASMFALINQIGYDGPESEFDEVDRAFYFHRAQQANRPFKVRVTRENVADFDLSSAIDDIMQEERL